MCLCSLRASIDWVAPDGMTGFFFCSLSLSIKPSHNSTLVKIADTMSDCESFIMDKLDAVLFNSKYYDFRPHLIFYFFCLHEICVAQRIYQFNEKEQARELHRSQRIYEKKNNYTKSYHFRFHKQKFIATHTHTGCVCHYSVLYCVYWNVSYFACVHNIKWMFFLNSPVDTLLLCANFNNTLSIILFVCNQPHEQKKNIPQVYFVSA